ncbi:hypothetical protein MPER_07714 [Moniliophthora perniciosa FA553]|nr:hypothetical protein MPER_07714 [Moniliophthora perniciosa FA553]
MICQVVKTCQYDSNDSWNACYTFEYAILIGYLLDPVTPQPEFDTTARVIDTWIRTNAASTRHTLGFAAMTKVVDSKLRLKGAKGISVVDASVFSLVLSRDVDQEGLGPKELMNVIFIHHIATLLALYTHVHY